PSSVEWIADEVAETVGFTEAVYDSAGIRRVPTLELVDSGGAGAPDDLESARGLCRSAGGLSKHACGLSKEDVVLVSGGGKGIAAECALALARQSGARLALLGRSSPDSDAELSANLHRFASYGVEFRYYSGDVADHDAVSSIAGQVRRDLGTITGIIHGAGV